MAKLSRTALKGIVKECLIEILNEGISGEAQDNGMQLNESKSLSGRTRSLSHASIGPSLDTAKPGNSGHPKAPNKNFEKNIRKAVNNLTSDPVLSSIFQDTARTTLQEQRSVGVTDSGQISHEAATFTQGDSAARTTSQSDPMQMFSGASEKWAELAFPSSHGK